jgi:DoxX-like family
MTATHPLQHAVAHASGSRRGRVIAAHILSGLAVLFLVFDAVTKFVMPAPVAQAFAQIGWPVRLAADLGTILLACTILYVVPRTSVLGAILLTGYLGGVVATHMRLGDPLFSHVLFPVYMGVLVWGGLYLRDERVRALIPMRRGK